ncbi:MAG: ABC transporter substrate-binding protein, partial [Myxococcales bacterium]
MNVARICSLVAALASSAALAQAPGKDIKIGGIFDLTGITSDVGKSFAKGVHDAVVWTNENGGFNGKRVNL